MAAAVALFSPTVVGLPWGTETWHLVLGVLGLVALCAATVELACEHRRMVSTHSWLDATGGVLGTAAVLITFAGPPLERASGMGAVERLLTLGCLSGLVAVACLVTALLVDVGAGADRRVVLLATGAWALLAAGASYVTGLVGLLDVPLLVDAAVAAVGCAGVLLALVVPPPPGLRPRPSGSGQRAVGSFVVVGEAAVTLLMSTPDWSARVAVVVAVGALVSATARLGLLLRDVTSLHAARELAMTDEVTGLGNRRALLADTAALLERARSAAASADPGAGAALLVLDVEGLHAITDVWGREVEDDLLRQVGARLAPTARAARIDGGVFGVLLPGAGAEQALALAGVLRDLLSEPVALPQGTARLRVAAGVALLVVGPGDRPAAGGDAAVDALRRAEAAATCARALGGEPVLHDSSLDEAAAARAELADALTRAVETEQLVLHYQPQLALGGAVVQGAEALVRWRDPEHGLVPPDVFVPLAEELGLQSRLTRWVVGEALREVARWRAQGSSVPVSVNLSPSDLRPELVDDVARALVAAGVPGSSLVLEITETGIVSDPDGAAAVLTALGELGVEISIDDYGTGYSSLSLLMALPVTELKIDRVFVKDLDTDARSAVVVRTTVDLAHSLGLRVVAEGVETAEVLQRLCELGCDVSQGYLHSRPLPAEDVRAWLLDGVQRAARQPVQQVVRQVAQQVVGAAAVTGP